MTPYQVYSFLGFRPAYFGTESTCQRVSTDLRKHSGCGWVVMPVLEVTVNGNRVPFPPLGPATTLKDDRFKTAADIIRNPEKAVTAAWKD